MTLVEEAKKLQGEIKESDKAKQRMTTLQLTMMTEMTRASAAMESSDYAVAVESFRKTTKALREMADMMDAEADNIEKELVKRNDEQQKESPES